MAKSSGSAALGTAKVLSFASLDKYLVDSSLDLLSVSLQDQSYAKDDPAEIVASLTREQERLTDELAVERRRGEALKVTLTNSLKETSDRHRSRLESLATILHSDERNPCVRRALAVIGDLDKAAVTEESNSQELSILTQQAKKAEELATEKQQENQQLRTEIKSLLAKRDELMGILEDLNSQIEAQSVSRHSIKDKLKDIAASYKKRETDWKERIEKLEAQLERR
jgi:hypothetical protein